MRRILIPLLVLAVAGPAGAHPHDRRSREYEGARVTAGLAKVIDKTGRELAHFFFFAQQDGVWSQDGSNRVRAARYEVGMFGEDAPRIAALPAGDADLNPTAVSRLKVSLPRLGTATLTLTPTRRPDPFAFGGGGYSWMRVDARGRSHGHAYGIVALMAGAAHVKVTGRVGAYRIMDARIPGIESYVGLAAAAFSTQDR